MLLERQKRRNDQAKQNSLSERYTNMEVAEKELIYLYCVTNTMPDLKEVESLVDKLYFVKQKSIYAVVSKVKENEFSEENLKKNLINLEWIKTKANNHERVIEGVMKFTCVVPFKFGTIFNSEDKLRVMLKRYAKKLKMNLENLAGKEEWGAKIYCNIDKLKEAIIQRDKDFLVIEKKIKSSTPGKAFLLKKKKEELLKQAVIKKINDYGQYSFDKLGAHSLHTHINKLLPKEFTQRKDDMILNAAFLIDKNKVDAFIDVTDMLKEQLVVEGFHIDCTGPWPPYNFCSPIGELSTSSRKKT
jgi:hypothetical protein